MRVLAALWWMRGRRADAATFEIVKSDEEWKRLLTPAAYKVLRQEGTERPFTSPLNNEKRTGTFACAGCDLPLFSSETKFESGTGWPSFYQPLPNAVGDRDRPFAVDRAHRGALPPLRRPSRPRVRGRAEADRPALLHERRGDDVQAGGRRRTGLSRGCSPAIIAGRRRILPGLDAESISYKLLKYTRFFVWLGACNAGTSIAASGAYCVCGQSQVETSYGYFRRPHHRRYRHARAVLRAREHLRQHRQLADHRLQAARTRASST